MLRICALILCVLVAAAVSETGTPPGEPDSYVRQDFSLVTIRIDSSRQPLPLHSLAGVMLP